MMFHLAVAAGMWWLRLQIIKQLRPGLGSSSDGDREEAGPVGETGRASTIHTQSARCDRLAPLGTCARESWDPLRPALADCSHERITRIV